jgi:signal transduction histidine kinase
MLLIKRPTDFLLFVYLAVVMSFLQVDARLTCQMMRVFATLTPVSVLLIAVIVASASLGVITTTFLPRYLRANEAFWGAVIHFAAFALAAACGVALRLLLAPAIGCPVITWPLQIEQWLTVFILVVVAASVFTAVLNIITPQKADYAEARQRMLAYVKALRNEPVRRMSTILDLLRKAYDAAERARMSEPSARYAHNVKLNVSEPLRHLIEFAEQIKDDQPEEYLRHIGYRDRGTVPDDAVAVLSAVQQALERRWSLRRAS